MAPANTYPCTSCKKKRAGRFTRPKSAQAGIKGSPILPAWHCFTCLPKGEGREEQTIIDVPTKTLKVTSTVPAPAKSEGMALITPLSAEVATLTVETEDDYVVADAIFGRIKAARRTWYAKMYGTEDRPGPIPSIRSGLDQLYALNREVDKPLEKLETAVEAKMKAYKLAEHRKLLEAENERIEREAAAQRELEALNARLEAAKTPMAKATVLQKIVEVEQQVEEEMAEPIPTPVQGHASSSRPKKVVTVTDFYAFHKAMGEGMIPLEVMELKIGKLQQLYREDPESVAAFPGVTVDDDIQIVGR